MDTITHPHPNTTLDLTVLSVEDLQLDPKLSTQNLYVVVRAESITCYTTAMAVKDEGGNPSWNAKFFVDMGTHARSITFELKCKTSTVVKDVGVARIALSDLVGGDHGLKFFSYRLRDWEGRCNGILNFSVTIHSPETETETEAETECSSGGDVLEIPVRGDYYSNASCRNV